MTKRTISKWWIWGAVAIAAGGIVITGSSLMMVARVMNDQAGKSGATADQAVTTDYLFWALIGLIVFGGVIAGAGVIGQAVAWWGALFNARRLANKTWYDLQLWSGIAAYGLAILWLPVAVTITLATNQTSLWAWYLPGGILALVIGWTVMIPYLAAAPDGFAVQQPAATLPVATPDGRVRTPAGVGQ